MQFIKYLLLVVSLLLLHSTNAFAAIGDNAARVSLRTSCTENGAAMDDCFDSVNALTAWMAATRKPNASAPLDVDVGPGTFGRLAITCDAANGYTGSIAFNGSGPEHSVFSFAAGFAPPFGILEVRNCTTMAFSNLKIQATPRGFAYGYMEWYGGGTSHWNNVVAVISARGWQEFDCAATPGAHYWFNSRIISHPVSNIGKTYEASCDNSWFFGSEIVFTTDKLGAFGGDGGGPYPFRTLIAKNGAEIHVYGSVIRALSLGGSWEGSLTAVTSESNGEVHIHGTGIDLIANDNKNLYALVASSGGMIHANESAYVMSAAGGSATRVSNNGGDIRAPYLWQEGPNPPDITSVTGSDMAVITNTGDGQPHLVIYSASCVSGWYDTALGQCNP